MHSPSRRRSAGARAGDAGAGGGGGRPRLAAVRQRLVRASLADSCRACGRYVVHGSHDRDGVAANRCHSRSRRSSPSARHQAHGGCLLLLDLVLRRARRRAARFARHRAVHRRGEAARRTVLARTSTRARSRWRARTRLQRRRPSGRGDRGDRLPFAAFRAAGVRLIMANILAGPLPRWRRRSPRISRRWSCHLSGYCRTSRSVVAAYRNAGLGSSPHRDRALELPVMQRR